jgi:hypothetical protein
MNTAEKIAGSYLRLNGFLLLPQFTIFHGDQHGHVDWVGLRAAGSKEIVGTMTFPTDDRFFQAIPPESCPCPRETLLGVAAEVRTNNRLDEPRTTQVDYVRQFLNGSTVIAVAFSESRDGPTWSDHCMEIGNIYALRWIIDERIRWMDQNCRSLTKSGSWTWSEDALADFLILQRYGAFGQAEPGAAPDPASRRTFRDVRLTRAGRPGDPGRSAS